MVGDPSTNSGPDLAGSRLGKYQIRRRIGRGGMGDVYAGYDPDLDRTVAVKVLAPHLVWQQEFVERFLREARSAARLKHPNIVTIHDVGQVSGWYYFVMEYLEGRSLTDLLGRGAPLTVGEALHILRHVAAALDYAHNREDLVHRDVKPGNVIVAPDGHVTLTDFGIARAGQETRLTRSGQVIGTPAYMSPEQALGHPVDKCSDQYALAVMAYEMLAGRVPFAADSTPALMYQVVHMSPPPLRDVRPDLPASVDRALSRALAKEPGKRYASCGEFIAALGEALAPVEAAQRAAAGAGAAVGSGWGAPPGGQVGTGAGVAASAAPLAVKARAFLRSRGWIVAGGAALVLGLSLGGIALAAWIGGDGQESQAAVVPVGGTTETATSTATPKKDVALTDGATPSAATTEAPEEADTSTPPSPGPSRTATRTSTSTPTRTGTPTDTPTARPTSTPTWTPTPSRTPSPTNTSPPPCPSVTGPFASIWQDYQERLGCATGGAQTVWMAEQPFQRGRMFWRKDRDVMYVLYDATGWSVYQNIWFEDRGDPVYACPDIAPEECPPTPLRGFGKLWCTYEAIRNGLGWATECERGYDGTLQDFEFGWAIRNDSGRIYVGLGDGSWVRR